MNQDRLNQLSIVTRALYLREFQSIKDIIEEENRIRTQLAHLDAQSARARNSFSANLNMQSVGADILWQGWHSATRRQLNIELARVMARKLEKLDKVRDAFSRQHAVDALADAEVSRRRNRLTKLREARLLNPACWQKD